MLIRALNLFRGTLVEREIDPETTFVQLLIARQLEGGSILVGGSLGREEVLVPLTEILRLVHGIADPLTSAEPAPAAGSEGREDGSSTEPEPTPDRDDGTGRFLSALGR